MGPLKDRSWGASSSSRCSSGYRTGGAWYLIIFGAVAVTIAIWQPRGLWGIVRDKFHFELLPVGYRVNDGTLERVPWHDDRPSWKNRLTRKKDATETVAT